MTILVDIDGVIFNTQETLLKWLNNQYKTKYTIEDITSYDWFDKTFFNPWELTKFEEFWNGVKASKQAIDCILKWKHEGHTIQFVTASHYNYTLPIKIRKLLDYFNGEFDDKDVIICHNKSMVRGDILIDDCFDNCKQFVMIKNQQSILYSQPWNVDQFFSENEIRNMTSYGTWEGVDAYIKFYIKFLRT